MTSYYFEESVCESLLSKERGSLAFSLDSVCREFSGACMKPLDKEFIEGVDVKK